jgi:inhibitor of cysteine peptidase
MRTNFCFVLAGAVLCAWASAAWAGLCPQCQNKFFTPPAGKCKSCGKETDYGALKLCPKCSAQRQECECCEAKTEVKAPEQPAAEPAPAEKPAPPPEKPAAPLEKPPVEEKPPATLPAETPVQATPLEKPGPMPIENLPEAKPPAEQQPAARERIDTTKPGVYTSGKWQYRLDFTDAGTRGEGRWGWLWYDAKKLPRGEVNDYYLTPWGPLYWVDVPKNRWGMHGWMMSPSPQVNRRGRQLNPAPAPANATADPLPKAPTPGAPAKPAPQPAVGQPPSGQPQSGQPQTVQAQPGPKPAATAKPQTLEVGRADSGKRAKVYVGNVIVVRLPGNPTTGFQWQAAAMNSPALRMAGQPQYVRAQTPAGTVGSGGTYVFQFQAVQTGATAIKLAYSRAWEKTKAPADTFTLNVEVAGQPAAAASSDRTAAQPSAGKSSAQAAPARRPASGSGGRFPVLLPWR